MMAALASATVGLDAAATAAAAATVLDTPASDCLTSPPNGLTLSPNEASPHRPSSNCTPPLSDILPASQLEEKEKVLGVTILTQLQELDIAIRLREQNKVDGRKTRWIEHRKNKEEQDKLSPGSVGTSGRRKRSDSGRRRHKKENIEVIGTSPLSSADASPAKTEPPDNNNTSFKVATPAGNMKLEVSEPLVSSAEPCNVIETMKHQFLQDTTKENPDSAKLTNCTPVNNNTQEKQLPDPEKKKRKKKIANAQPSVKTAKKKVVVKPAKRPVKKASKPKENKLKEKKLKEKKTKNATVVSKKQNAALPKDISISNFFSKQKTRGLREVRKSESEGSATEEEDDDDEDEVPGTEDKKQVTVSAPRNIQPSKCPLIAAAAKIVTGKGKKASAKAVSKVATVVKKRKVSPHRAVSNGNKQRGNAAAGSKKKSKKVATNGAVVADSLPGVDVPHTQSDQESVSNGSDVSEPTDLSKRVRGRGCKRKHQGDNGVASPPKCSKKTSTVVAEVHKTMNGEPQSGVSVVKPVTAIRKRNAASPVKSGSAVAEAAPVNGSHAAKCNIAAGVVTPQSQRLAIATDDGKTATLPEEAAMSTTNQHSTAMSDLNLPVASAKQCITHSSDPLPNLNISNGTAPPQTSRSVTSLVNESSSSAHSAADPSKGASIVTRSSSASSVVSTKISVPEGDSPVKSQLSSPSQNTGCIPLIANNVTSPNTVTNTVSSPTSKALTNGHSAKNIPSTKSSEQVKESSTIVPEKSSRKKTASPIKLIRSPSTKALSPSKSSTLALSDTDADTVAASSAEQSVGNEQSGEINGTVAELQEDVSIKLPNSSSDLLTEEPKQSSPKRKSPQLQSGETTKDSEVEKKDCPSITENELRTKSPTGSDCDNNNSRSETVSLRKPGLENGVQVTTSNSLVNGSEATADLQCVGLTDTEKPPGKIPRYLKQLFKDEGVQNMLKSMEEDSLEGGVSAPAESVTHKLRPKRFLENYVSISPEPELESVFYHTSVATKKKRKYNELDNLYLDEGTLNLLSSLDGISRRGTPTPIQDDQSLNTNASESSKSVKSSCAASTNTTAVLQEHKKSKTDDCKSKALAALNSAVTEAKLNSSSAELSSKESLAKRKVGRPIKAKGNSTSKSSPPTTAAAANADPEVTRVDTNRKSDEGMKSKVGGSNNETSISGGSEVRSNTKVASPPAATVATATNNTSVPACAAASVVVNHNVKENSTTAAGSDKQPQQQQPHQNKTPVKMRRADLPTSPTVNSMASLVRSLEESEGAAPRGASVVPTSSVAFMQDGVPDGLVPPLMGMNGLNAIDGDGPGASNGGLRQSQRTSARQNTDSWKTNFRDIILRKMNNFVHIIMAPQTTKIKNSLNSRVLRELCTALRMLRSDSSVRLVLLTSNGSAWCQGVDLTSLHHQNIEIRNNHAQNLTRSIKEFLKMLVQFPKPIIAGVNGNAMGLGVTMLPLFDMVFASDNAEFYLPYFKLGQVPEGGATYTFPSLFGKLQSTRLFMGRKITASEGVELGLVSETLWPSTFQENLLPKVALLATHSSQSMEETKALMNHHLLSKLELSVESECQALLTQWTSAQFDTLSRRFLDSHSPPMQKPVIVPL